MTPHQESKRQNCHAVSHEAMATTFLVRIQYDTERYARQAAAAAFAELDRIEGRLSRFVEASDISRVNRLAAGQAAVVQPETFECLEIALEVQHETGGAFDVAYASAVSPAASVHNPAQPCGKGDSHLLPERPFGCFAQKVAVTFSAGPRFELCRADHAVRVLADGVRLDLGGIGKGFALDRMATVLTEWEIEAALLCASTSTVLALAGPPGEPGWPVSLGPDHDRRRFHLAHQAVSGSGKSVKGDHVIDPRSGRPAQGCVAAWAVAPSAAQADALSTALMLMPDEAIRRYCQRYPQVSAYVQRSASAGLACFGEGRRNEDEGRRMKD